MQMASRVQTDEDAGERSKVWILDQKLDQPMEEEAKRLRNMYKEKVWCIYLFWDSLSLSLFLWNTLLEWTISNLNWKSDSKFKLQRLWTILISYAELFLFAYRLSKDKENEIEKNSWIL